jgi:hypothetical protein
MCSDDDEPLSKHVVSGSRRDMLGWCKLFLLCLLASHVSPSRCALHGWDDLFDPSSVGPKQNMAASSLGGRAFAAHSQPSFGAELAIDGKEEDSRGWAYHGKLEDAVIAVVFNATSIISEIRIASGLGMSDHRIVTFRLYYWPSQANAGIGMDERLEAFLHAPRNWTYDLGAGWRPVEGITAGSSDTSVAIVGHVIYSTPHRLVPHGHHRYVLNVRPLMARAIAMRVERSDAPYGNAVLNELAALGAPASPRQQSACAERARAILAAAESDAHLNFSKFLESQWQQGKSPAAVLRSMTRGFWTSLPRSERGVAGGGRGAVGASLEGVRARGRRNLRCQAGRASPKAWLSQTPVPRLDREVACKALSEGAGLDILFIGDSRTRQLVVAVLLLLENVLPRLSRGAPANQSAQHGGGGQAGGQAGGVREGGSAGAGGGSTGDWHSLHHGVHESSISFLGPEWKDVAVPSELAANCSGSKRYQHANSATCAGVLVLSHRACQGKVGVHFVESWSRDHITSVLRAVRKRMVEASASGSTLLVVDGSGLHFIMGGSGLRAGYDGYLAEIVRTMQAFEDLQGKAGGDVSGRPDGEAGQGAGRGQGGPGGQGGGCAGARGILVKSLIEPYSVAGSTNVLNNWNIASMNTAAAEALHDAAAACAFSPTDEHARAACAAAQACPLHPDALQHVSTAATPLPKTPQQPRPP